MNTLNKNKSIFNYKSGEGGIDSYGVDHSGFTLRDELEYQMARTQREQELLKSYNANGITNNNLINGTSFWGNSADNNYGFGTSNISQNVENVTNQLKNSGEDRKQDFDVKNYKINTFMQPNDNLQNNNKSNYIFAEKQEQKQRDVVNQILMNGMDIIYGMNRAVNGITFGGLDWLGSKLGYDTQMNAYLQLKSPEERKFAQTVGQVAQFGGNVLTGGALAKSGLNQVNIAYNGYKIGKKYDQLIDNPYQGNGKDVIARMRNHNGEPVVLQRGEAIPDTNGNVTVYGKDLRRFTGTERNYGLNKGIYKHDVSRVDAQRIPKIIQQKPVETNNYGQNMYLVRSKNGVFRVVTSPIDGDNIISTMYYVDR